MSVLIAIALKSLLVAGLTLGLLALMKNRSAAERSWIAHIGLLALVIMAFAPLALPRWTVEAPALLGHASATEVSTMAITPADPYCCHEASRYPFAPRHHTGGRGFGRLRDPGSDPAADHSARPRPARRPSRPRRRARRRPLAERPRPRPAAHGVQAWHGAARRSAGA